MNLIGIARVGEITGLCRAAIGQKVRVGNFPKQVRGEPGVNEPYLWNERAIIDWYVALTKRVLRLNKAGYKLSKTFLGKKPAIFYNLVDM